MPEPLAVTEGLAPLLRLAVGLRVALLLRLAVVLGVAEGVAVAVGVTEPVGVPEREGEALQLPVGELEAVLEGEACRERLLVGDTVRVLLELSVVEGVGTGELLALGVALPVLVALAD